MPLVNFKRLLQPVILYNEKETTYVLGSLARADVQELLSSPLFQGGGIFGIEGLFGKEPSPMVAFAPIQVKLGWKRGLRDPRFLQLAQSPELVQGLQASTQKPSMFPIQLEATVSVIEQLEQLATDHVLIYYQVLLNYRQDAWQERLLEQYEAYLEGVEAPADSKGMRSIQKKMNQTMDRFLSWEYKHLPIEELEEKVTETGYQYNIRIILVGGNKHEQKKIKQQVEIIFQSFAYLNDWRLHSYGNHKLFIEQIQRRKMDLSTKMHVLTTSELVPLLVRNPMTPIEKAAPLIKKTTTHALFDWLPLGKEPKVKEEKEMAQRLTSALLTLNLTVDAVEVHQIQSGPTSIRLAMYLPKKLKLSDLTKRTVVEDLQAYLGAGNIRVTQGDKVGEVYVYVPVKERQPVYLRNYLDQPGFSQFAKKNVLPFLAGVNEIGEPIYGCLSKLRHLLVAGGTGSGKSVWINQLLLTLLLTKTSKELHCYLIDVKQVEFSIYKDFPQVQAVIIDANLAIGLLNELINEMNKRYTLFEEQGVRNIAQYNQKNQATKLPYLVCAVDEYSELKMRNPNVDDYIVSLGQLARAAGIHLIIATQDPRADVISGLIKNNLPSKIAFRCGPSTYTTFLNTKPPFHLLGKGDGSLSLEGQVEEHVRFQGCLIVEDLKDENKEAELIRAIGKNLAASQEKPNQGLTIVSEETWEPMTEKDRLKQVIATTGETRVTQLRELMKVNMNRLNDLMKELVEEGWLLKPETKQQGYQIGVEEEELEKWRE